MNIAFAKLFEKMRKPGAETLAEAVMAITVLGIGAGGVMVMLNSAIRANDIGQERIVALNLAEEGVAAVEVLRDTNWLRFPANRDECWDTLTATSADGCAASVKLGDADGETYVVYRELGDTNGLMTWGFANISYFSATSNPTAEAARTLRQYMIDTLPNGKPFLSHALSGNATLVSTVTPGNYQRTVTVTKIITLSAEDTMSVTSTVTWTSRGQEHSVSFSGMFYNFL